MFALMCTPGRGGVDVMHPVGFRVNVVKSFLDMPGKPPLDRAARIGQVSKEKETECAICMTCTPEKDLSDDQYTAHNQWVGKLCKTCLPEFVSKMEDEQKAEDGISLIVETIQRLRLPPGLEVMPTAETDDVHHTVERERTSIIVDTIQFLANLEVVPAIETEDVDHMAAVESEA